MGDQKCNGQKSHLNTPLSIVYPNHTWLIGSVAQYPRPAPGYGGQTAPVGGALNVTYWGLANV